MLFVLERDFSKWCYSTYKCKVLLVVFARSFEFIFMRAEKDNRSLKMVLLYLSLRTEVCWVFFLFFRVVVHFSMRTEIACVTDL